MNIAADSWTTLDHSRAPRCSARAVVTRGMHVRKPHWPSCLGYGCRKGNGLMMKRGVRRLEAVGPEDAEPKLFNPFEKKDKNKEDAAKKALEEMFSGKTDVLAAFDGDGGDGGGDNSDGGGGGGGGGGWNWGDWKGRLGTFGRNFMKMINSLGKTVGAILLFAAVVLGLSMIRPAASWLIMFFRVLLRLEKPSEVYANPAQPAGMQRSVLFDEDEKEDEGEDVDDE